MCIYGCKGGRHYGDSTCRLEMASVENGRQKLEPAGVRRSFLLFKEAPSMQHSVCTPICFNQPCSISHLRMGFEALVRLDYMVLARFEDFPKQKAQPRIAI